MISVNDIVQYTQTNMKYRILWLSQDNTIAYVIRIDGNAFPLKMETNEIQQNLSDKTMVLIQDDPLEYMMFETHLSEKNYAFRDNIWEKLEELLTNEPDIYDKTTRGKLIYQTLKKTDMSKATLYKHIKKYWQCGKNRNAFLFSVVKRGGKGTKKSSTQKLGRPQKYGDSTGKYIDDKTEKVFNAVVRKYYHTRMERTFKATYETMVKEYYSIEVIGENGKKVLELLPSEQIPTLNQFLYWYKKSYLLNETLRAKKGESAYNLRHRAITGKSDVDVMGPGAKYQIDATIGDIYLVSQFNRADIIGRPILYFVIDVFSRMVTGMYIGLEGPSWTGAMMALANAASDKVKFCLEYGVEIKETDWACHHIPNVILGDRGEMESKLVDNLINTLGIRIENAPPYRADMKGIVERYFRTVDTTVTAFLPGHVKPDMAQRGGHDYRYDAKFNLKEFTQVIIECVLYHNNEHFLESFERNEDMINDNVQPIPIKIWEWGVENRSGLLRSFPEDIVKLCLMPTAKASVTAKGIRFEGIHYLCDIAIKENWFEKARAKGSFQVDISYDTRNMSQIYLRNINSLPYEICYLADWQEKYSGKYLDEIVYLHESEKLSKQGYSHRKLTAKINLNAKIEQIVSEATEQAKQTPMPKSKAQRIGNIRANREREKNESRRDEAFVLGDTNNSSDNIPNPVHQKKDKDLLYLDLIRKNAEERKYDNESD